MEINSEQKRDWELEAYAQGVKEVPPCSRNMQARLQEINPEKMYITMTFPVMEHYSNPAGSMQAGFYSAAFDNVFGPLCLVASGTPNSVAINLNTEYHRPTFPGDEISITARVIRNGRSRVFMSAEAFNRDKKLVATSTSNYLILDRLK